LKAPNEGESAYKRHLTQLHLQVQYRTTKAPHAASLPPPRSEGTSRGFFAAAPQRRHLTRLLCRRPGSEGTSRSFFAAALAAKAPHAASLPPPPQQVKVASLPPPWQQVAGFAHFEIFESGRTHSSSPRTSGHSRNLSGTAYGCP